MNALGHLDIPGLKRLLGLIDDEAEPKGLSQAFLVNAVTRAKFA